VIVLDPDRPLYAWVTQLPDGTWTTIGLRTVHGEVPMLSHNREDVERHGGIARAHGIALGQPVALVMWSGCTVLQNWPK
jgi:hypothetical protein